MNYKKMGRFIGQILLVQCIFMVPALVMSLCMKEESSVRSFLITIALLGILGLGLRRKNQNSQSFFKNQTKNGCIPRHCMVYCSHHTAAISPQKTSKTRIFLGEYGGVSV